MEEPVFDEGAGVGRGLGRTAGFPVDDLLAMAAHSAQMAAIAEISTLQYTVEWAAVHGPEAGPGATFGRGPALLDLLHEIPLAGEGAPLVREDAIAEFAVALGMSDGQARSWVGDCLELAYRLPKTFERLVEEHLPVWKARLVAAATRPLSVEGAAWMDAQLAHRFEKVGHTRLTRLITYALTRFDPDEAARRAEAAAEGRKVDVHLESAAVNQDGLVDTYARTDLPDAVDFDAAVALVAEEQRAGGSEESLDVRRAKAVGIIARRILAGDLSVAPSSARDVSLYIHLDADPAMAAWARLESPDTLVPVARVKEWLTGAGRVIVRPVIDLNEDLVRTPYAPSEKQREQLFLTEATCVHPYCTKRARKTDLDHINAYDKNGPPGQTRSSNLAPLCRYHHRLKTFTAWFYVRLPAGMYLWRTPSGEVLLRTRDGTTPISFAA